MAVHERVELPCQSAGLDRVVVEDLVGSELTAEVGIAGTGDGRDARDHGLAELDAVLPTPPLASTTRSRWPLCKRSPSRRTCTAVKPTAGSAAAETKSMVVGAAAICSGLATR
ncbi:hypothetical protein [Streptomyces sp. Go-475]|uniref:hypothetical protein n=1 Tax=Streptomyces sp. Go-475 TaxID=2072505 RepID=UPI000DEF7182|nr:hypothetical protein [Streptomyces sp. Go-475]